MAAISFMAGATTVNNLAGSGLGFFGGSFGQSVQINQFQDTTFITDGAGTTQKGAADNVKYATDTTAYAAGIVFVGMDIAGVNALDLTLAKLVMG